MTGIEWNERYSVGIQSIDDQHKEIFRLLDQLLQALKLGKAPQMLLRTITELEVYATSHFYKEEFFFREFNFPDSASHVREHEHFLKKINSLKGDAREGKLQSSLDLLYFLNGWIAHHILIVDIQYSDHFQQNGLR